MKALLALRRHPDRVVALGGRRALAGQRRARRPHSPVQGAAAQALLRRPRLGAVRAHLRASRVLPDARPSGRSSSARPGDRRAAPAPASSSSSAPAPRTRRASCSTRWRDAGTLEPLRPARRLRDGRRGRRAPARRRVRGPPGSRRDRRLRAPSRARSGAARRPRIVALLGGTIGNFPPGTPPRAAAQDRLAAARRGQAAARHGPGQGPARDRGGLRRLRWGHGRVQPEPAARHQP